MYHFFSDLVFILLGYTCSFDFLLLGSVMFLNSNMMFLGSIWSFYAVLLSLESVWSFEIGLLVFGSTCSVCFGLLKFVWLFDSGFLVLGSTDFFDLLFFESAWKRFRDLLESHSLYSFTTCYSYFTYYFIKSFSMPSTSFA